MTTPYQPPSPNYGWFVDPHDDTATTHRLPTGAIIVNRDGTATVAICGAAAARWVAMDDYSDPEGVFAKCPTCQRGTSNPNPPPRG